MYAYNEQSLPQNCAHTINIVVKDKILIYPQLLVTFRN